MHDRDFELLSAVRDYLKLPNKIYRQKPYRADGFNRGNRATLVVRELSSLKNIIVPFFYKNLIGNKGKQFDIWIESIGKDAKVRESYKLIYRLYKSGYWDKPDNFLYKWE